MKYLRHVFIIVLIAFVIKCRATSNKPAISNENEIKKTIEVFSSLEVEHSDNDSDVNEIDTYTSEYQQSNEYKSRINTTEVLSTSSKTFAPEEITTSHSELGTTTIPEDMTTLTTRYSESKPNTIAEEITTRHSVSEPTTIFEEITTRHSKFESTTIFTSTAEAATIKCMDCESSEEWKNTQITFPYAVSILKRGAHYVSGALVDKQWVLSVASEFIYVREALKLFRVRLGSTNCKSGGTLLPIKRVEIHPYYIYNKPNFDLALLRLASVVEFSNNIKPISISLIEGNLIDAKFLTTYWPRIVQKSHVVPSTAKERLMHNSMRVSTQDLIPRAACLKNMSSSMEVLNEASMCLKPIVTHHSVCMPDPGAPVVAEDGLWGITSGWISKTCPDTPAPTIFTKLSSPSVRAWLDIHIYDVIAVQVVEMLK